MVAGIHNDTNDPLRIPNVTSTKQELVDTDGDFDIGTSLVFTEHIRRGGSLGIGILNDERAIEGVQIVIGWLRIDSKGERGHILDGL